MRPRKPTAELEFTDTFRRDRHGGRLDAATLPGPLDKPGHLSPDAGLLWDEITATLPPGTLAAIDRAALTACCEWFARWQDLDRRLQAGDGDEYKLLTLASVASKQFLTIAAKFGLSPCDRARLAAPLTTATGIATRRRETEIENRYFGTPPGKKPPAAADVGRDAG